MVDLLSCAFGGGIFLFLLTAAPSDGTEASPQAVHSDGILTIRLTSTVVRPIFVLKQMKTGFSFIVDGASLTGQSAYRKVANSKSHAAGGNVYAVGSTPWDAERGSRLHVLTLKFETPAAEWCIRYATASDDTSARARGADQIQGAPIQIKARGPRAARWIDVKLDQTQSLPPALQISPCYAFSF